MMLKTVSKNDRISMNVIIYFKMLDINRSTTQKSNIEELRTDNYAVSKLTGRKSILREERVKICLLTSCKS